MKTVYVFFFSTPFKTGDVIRFLTHNKYNHVAFSLEANTSQLYSFARYRYREPLLAGFGIEYTDRYHRADRPVDIRVCAVEVTDEHYERIKRRLHYYMNYKTRTRYNYFDIFFYPFRHHVELEYTHTCLSFVCELLERHDSSIGGLEHALSGSIVYSGPLDKFEETPSVGPIDFFEHRSKVRVAAKSGAAMGGLALTLIRKFV